MEKIPHNTILYDVEKEDIIDVVNELISKQGEIVGWINKQKKNNES